MKRVRKAKADGVDGVAIADDGPSREQIPGAHSILEISGPTIPSPGPSGTLCGVIVISLSLLSSELMVVHVCGPLSRSLEGLHKSWLAGTRGVPANTKDRPDHCDQHLAGCFC